MSAFTGSPSQSTQYAQQVGGKAYAGKVQGRLQTAEFHYTHALGAGTGTIYLVRLPAGNITIYPDLSRLVTSQFGASATLSIGYAAYTKQDGTAVSASTAAFVSAGAAGAGALDIAITLPAIGYVEYDTKNGLEIIGTVASGNIEDDDTIDGFITFSTN